jgi:restriction endonuclease XhoI-like protein
MALNLKGTERLTAKAVAHYWRTLDEQGAKQREKQREGAPDRGTRADVTGGKQMRGFCKLIEHLLKSNGLKDGHIYLDRKLELPGFFRPTKNWDLLVVHDGTLLAAMEFKS